ncbi:MAG: N(4)-(beta-N-acetylglucosaminyl)-L-asparaginase [Saprospiraceae bacterium]|nr:N(4)-(beta-N-acetylglucosaminyl)-L-asparaginase [Saprospiraceae bacterium]
MLRRNFLKFLGLSSGSVLMSTSCNNKLDAKKNTLDEFGTIDNKPVIVSTWKHGLEANEAAWTVIDQGGSALDAVEKGVMVTESDPKNTSVGIGGTPDRDGNVTLDACIMNHEGDCGAVAFLKEIENPIAVARLVMEKTPHVMLVGKGAQEFAVQQGFKRKNLLTESSRKAWEEWKKVEEYTTPINIENHDTISMLAIDKDGNMSGACTTSGLGYKMHGRVGDSPIIGASLFVDNEVGGACATGVGEMVIRVVGSHLVVELMRQGYKPELACKMAVERIISKHKSVKGMQVGFLALNKNGESGGYAIYEGFNFAKHTKSGNELIDTPFFHKW